MVYACAFYNRIGFIVLIFLNALIKIVSEM